MTVLKLLSPVSAWRLLQDRQDAVLVDVRSGAEYFFVGHPAGAANVPWMDEPHWRVNPDFSREVRHTLRALRPGQPTETIPVLLICRSGVRSLAAAQALLVDGFQDVYNVAYGFEGEIDAQHHRSTVNGWRFEGLPWEQC